MFRSKKGRIKLRNSSKKSPKYLAHICGQFMNISLKYPSDVINIYFLKATPAIKIAATIDWLITNLA